MNTKHILSLSAAALALASCSLPPAQAWRIVKSEGLFPYMAMEMGKKPFPAGMKPSPTSAAPKPATMMAAAPAVTQPSNPYLAQASAPSATPVEQARRPIPTNIGASTVAPTIAKKPEPAVTRPTPRLSSAPVQAKKPAPAKSAPVAAAKKPEAPTSKPAALPQKKPVVASAPVTKPTSPATKPATTPTPSKPKGDAAPATPKKEVAANKPAAPAAAPAAAKIVDESIPFGIPIPGRPGLVNSPFAGKLQIVDVSGLKAGQEVKCPFSGKLFRVPSGDTAVNKVASPAPPEAAKK